jgi:peptidoglycan hydrolase-like amidase
MDISVRITRDENAAYFGVQIDDVVKVPLEEYVAAVVASEVGNAHPEACKAQAVASRTFAVSKGVLAGKVISDSSSTDQAYRAKRYNRTLYPNAVQAAEDTEGQILLYNGEPINAVYSACNGGRTVSSEERWGGARPYLIAQDDPWDDSTVRTGHGVGMSQRGAKHAAAIGKTYLEILAFYYPGTGFEGGERTTTAFEFIEKVLIPYREGWG